MVTIFFIYTYLAYQLTLNHNKSHITYNILGCSAFLFIQDLNEFTSTFYIYNQQYPDNITLKNII